jgi:hypothetical protein
MEEIVINKKFRLQYIDIMKGILILLVDMAANT